MHQFLFYNEFIIFLYMFRAQVLIIRRSKLCYTASGIVAPIGGRPVHSWREQASSSNAIASIEAVGPTQPLVQLVGVVCLPCGEAAET